jgi:hypothetical protein
VWIYSETDYDLEGNVFGEPRIDTMAIISDTLIDSELWYCVTSTLDQNHQHFTVRSDGVHIWYGPDVAPTLDTSSQVYLPYSPERPYRTVHAGSVIISTDGSHEDVSVPAGSYSSVPYKMRVMSGDPHQEYWMFVAPGVGPILWRKYRVSGREEHMFSKCELLQFTLR